MEDILEPSCVPLREAQPVHDIRRLAIGGLRSLAAVCSNKSHLFSRLEFLLRYLLSNCERVPAHAEAAEERGLEEIKGTRNTCKL